MKKIKTVFNPTNILDPGTIVSIGTDLIRRNKTTILELRRRGISRQKRWGYHQFLGVLMESEKAMSLFTING